MQDQTYLIGLSLEKLHLICGILSETDACFALHVVIVTQKFSALVIHSKADIYLPGVTGKHYCNFHA